VYVHGATDLLRLPNISSADCHTISSRFTLASAATAHVARSADGTRKLLVSVPAQPGKGTTVETVFIPAVANPPPAVAAAAAAAAGRPPPVCGDTDGVDSGGGSGTGSGGDLIDRGALCVSSQIGCSLQCAFCHTGTMPKSELRNLSAAEIVAQVMLAKRELGDFHTTLSPALAAAAAAAATATTTTGVGGLSTAAAAAAAATAVTSAAAGSGSGAALAAAVGSGSSAIGNIVFMGMGEPGFNYRSVKAAIEILTDPSGLALAKRRVTVSTSGVVPVIDKLGTELGVSLSISLHAVRDDIRDALVPINKQWALGPLLAACRRYPGVKSSRPVTWEYVMLRGINDTDADARALVELLRGIPSLVNLIPFNPWPGSGFQCSTPERISAFRDIVAGGGLVSDGAGGDSGGGGGGGLTSEDNTAAPGPQLPEHQQSKQPPNQGGPRRPRRWLRVTVRTARGQDILAACGQLAVLRSADAGVRSGALAPAAAEPAPEAAEADALLLPEQQQNQRLPRAQEEAARALAAAHAAAYAGATVSSNSVDA
jgi:adenine C2-methylase RlmN of 23S rRNA A2503 and tRNA A37